MTVRELLYHTVQVQNVNACSDFNHTIEERKKLWDINNGYGKHQQMVSLFIYTASPDNKPARRSGTGLNGFIK